MADNLESVTILCQGGLDTTENHLYLDQVLPGGASRLVNYEVGLYGGYRRINGYEPWDAAYETVDSVGAEGPILGLAIFTDSSNVTHVMAARKQLSGATYDWYGWESGVGWVKYTTGLTLTSTGVSKISKEKFNFGNMNYIIFCDGVNGAVVFDGTDWYELSSSGAGTEADPGGDQILDKPKYVKVFKNHIFLSGDSDYPAIVCHSSPEDPFNWTVANGGGQIIAGYEVNGIRPFRSLLYVFGKQKIKNISVESTNFVINDTANNIGCIAPESILEINGDIIFLAQDGIRNVSGTDKIGDVNLATISKSIQQIINHFQDNYDLLNLDGIVIKKKSQFRYFINNGAADDNPVGLIGGLRGTDSEGTRWEFSELNGISTNTVENDYYNDIETILHGDFSGNVYKQESGNTFDGNVITSVYSTPYLSLGNSLLRKGFRHIDVFIRSEGAMTLNLNSKIDWGNPKSHNALVLTNSFSASEVLYDSGLDYDDDVFYTTEGDFNVLEYDTEGSFNSLQLTFTTSDSGPPHSMQGFIIEFSTQGKRK